MMPGTDEQDVPKLRYSISKGWRGFTTERLGLLAVEIPSPTMKHYHTSITPYLRRARQSGKERFSEDRMVALIHQPSRSARYGWERR